MVAQLGFGFHDRIGETDEWWTPRWIFHGLKTDFALDVAAPEGGVPWIPAARHFSEVDDGLIQDWWGFVWMNPPYSDLEPWVKKCAKHGNGLALLFARTDTAWWQKWVAGNASAVLFLRGRVNFYRKHNPTSNSAGAPSAIVAYGSRGREVLERCGIPGWLVFGGRVL